MLQLTPKFLTITPTMKTTITAIGKPSQAPSWRSWCFYSIFLIVSFLPWRLIGFSLRTPFLNTTFLGYPFPLSGGLNHLLIRLYKRTLVYCQWIPYRFLLSDQLPYHFLIPYLLWGFLTHHRLEVESWSECWLGLSVPTMKNCHLEMTICRLLVIYKFD